MKMLEEGECSLTQHDNGRAESLAKVPGELAEIHRSVGTPPRLASGLVQTTGDT